jgi:hypothetical protein
MNRALASIEIRHVRIAFGILATLLFTGCTPAQIPHRFDFSARAHAAGPSAPTHATFIIDPLFRSDGLAILNNLALTPGAATGATAKTLCAATAAGSAGAFQADIARSTAEASRQQVCSRYGLAPAQCTASLFEIDHLIPLALGGSDELANLWPQPYLPLPGAKQKGTADTWLLKQVCAGKITLGAAQRETRTNWYQVWLASGGGK